MYAEDTFLKHFFNTTLSGFTTVPEMPAARPDKILKKKKKKKKFFFFFLVPFCGVLPFAF